MDTIEPIDMDLDDEQTEPRMKVDATEKLEPARSVPTTPLPATAAAATVPLSRRKFMGKSIGGLAAIGGAGVAAAVGGVALEQWLQHRGSTNLFHGPMGSSAQIGHLLRRAGFGANLERSAGHRTNRH